MEIFNYLTLPKDDTSADKWLLDNRDTVIAELKDYYEGCLDNCGPDDDINTIPAKELYEKASLDILSCKDEIQAFYTEVEFWNKIIEEESERMEKNKVIKERFKVVK